MRARDIPDCKSKQETNTLNPWTMDRILMGDQCEAHQSQGILVLPQECAVPQECVSPLTGDAKSSTKSVERCFHDIVESSEEHVPLKDNAECENLSIHLPTSDTGDE